MQHRIIPSLYVNKLLLPIIHCLPCSGMELLLILSDFKVDYAISPLKDRLLNRLRSVDLPLTFIYGEKSPYNNCGGEDVRKELKRLRNKDIVRVEEIKGCGHHVYAEEADVVSDIILEV